MITVPEDGNMTSPPFPSADGRDADLSPRKRPVPRSPASPLTGTEVRKFGKRQGSSLRDLTQASYQSLNNSVKNLMNDEFVEEADNNSPVTGMKEPAPAARAGLVLKPDLEPGEELYMEVDSVDLKAHNGLRGLAAILVMVFHCVYYSEAQDLFLGTTIVGQMSFFFVLAGYTLTVVYGRKKWKPTGCCASKDAKGSAFNSSRFWVNRMARIMPMYWLTNLMMLPMAFVGHGHNIVRNRPHEVAISLVLSVFGGNTWFLDIFQDMNLVNWTISMIVFWYWAFPCILTRAQKKTSDQLRRGIAWQVVYSSVLYVVLFKACEKLFVWWNMTHYGDSEVVATSWKSMEPAWWAAYTNPITRMPCFIMGVYAGLLSLRETADYNPLWFFAFMGFCKPCGNSQCLPCTDCCCKTEQGDEETPEEIYNQQALCCVGLKAGGKGSDERIWAWRTDIWTLIYIGSNVFFSYRCPQLECILDPTWIMVSITIYPVIFLAILVGVTRCGGTSWTYKVIDNVFFNFYGVIGLTVYMLHFPIIHYISYLVHGNIMEEYHYCFKPFKWYLLPDPENLCHDRLTEASCNLPSIALDYRTGESTCIWRNGVCDYKAAICFTTGEFWKVSTMPVWGIWVTCAATTVLAYLLTLYFEIPARNFFRRCSKGNASVQASGLKPITMAEGDSSKKASPGDAEMVKVTAEAITVI